MIPIRKRIINNKQKRAAQWVARFLRLGVGEIEIMFLASFPTAIWNQWSSEVGNTLIVLKKAAKFMVQPSNFITFALCMQLWQIWIALK